MSHLHPAPILARLLLACFALALGVASAAPLVRGGPALERLCSAAGQARWVVWEGPAAPADAGHALGLECGLCLPPMLGPVPRYIAPPPALAPVRLVPTLARQEHVAALSRAPFPPRAPPR